MFYKDNTGARQYTRAVLSIFDWCTIWATGISVLNLWWLAHHNTYETYLIYPVSMIAISSLDFLLLSCLYVRLRNALLKIMKHMSSTGIIRNFGRLRAILWKWFNRLSRLNFTCERNSFLLFRLLWPYHLHAEAVVLIYKYTLSKYCFRLYHSWDSLISKDFIFEVSSQSLKRREAEKMEI